MQIITRRTPAGVLLLALIQLAGSALAQPQSPEQQRCITALNGGFAKVAKARSKAVVRCARAAQKGDAFDACLGEQQQKLDKAFAKLESTEGKKCSAAPDFGPGNVAVLGDAAAQLADTALSDLLGLALDSAIADKKQAKDMARCQLGVAKAAQKCAMARVSAFNRCKKAGLKSGAIASAADLAACLDDDASGRLAKTCTAKLAKAAGRCDAIDIAAAFPACGASDAAGLAACADGRLACRARDALSAADALDVPGCGAITPEPETALAATADIGPEGGEVSAVGGDGTVYRLSVPSGALLSETAITITPVSAIPDLPLTGDLLAAVEFAPDGLQLWQPATLTIELPSAPDPTDLAGFGWTGPGENVHLSLIGLTGSTLTLGVTHFSGAGAAIVAPENLAALDALPPGGVEQQYLNQLPATGEVDPLVWVAWLSAWFDDGVKPLLESATASDETLLSALSEFVAWRTMTASTAPFALGFEFDFFLGLDGFALANRIDEGLALAVPALREGVVRNDIECAVEDDLAYAEAELRWQAIAASLGLATEANGLDLDTIMDDFCVEVVFEAISYPESPQIGVAGQLHLELGYAFGGGATFTDQDFDVIIVPTGTVEGDDDHPAPGGVLDAFFTPTGDPELELFFVACLATPDDYPVLSLNVCQDGFVVRGFEVTPEDAELEPGEEEDFDAFLYGQPHPSVTWTATGGEITSDGVYTAGDVAGTFTITATSGFTGLTETASVTIGDGTDPNLVFEPLDLIARAIAGSHGCELPIPDNAVETALLDAYPSLSLTSTLGNGSGAVALDVDVDEATGVVTITGAASSSASSQPCPPETFFPNTSAQGNGFLNFEVDFDPGETPYTYEMNGSVSGSGEFDVSVRFFDDDDRIPGFANCTIGDHGISSDSFSCPDGATISASGPLPAGHLRLNANAPAHAGPLAAGSATYDFTLTLTPQ